MAFPTETVYGLGANALDPDAVARIFVAKGRPTWDPLIVHITDSAMLAVVAGESISKPARELMAAFWPGPLTLLLPKAAQIPEAVTAGRSLVGVRMSAHPVAHALITAAGVPIAAPSANTFGRVSPTLADHVLEDLEGRIDAVLDAGETRFGLESTVVDASQKPVVLYRPGVISIEALRVVCGDVTAWKPSQSQSESRPEALPSPGVGIRHYAPRAELLVIGEPCDPHAKNLYQAVEESTLRYPRVGVLLPPDHPAAASVRGIPNIVILDWGKWKDAELLGHNLFAGLRALDKAGVDIILCPLPAAGGIGAAIRDRLLKGAKL